MRSRGFDSCSPRVYICSLDTYIGISFSLSLSRAWRTHRRRLHLERNVVWRRRVGLQNIYQCVPSLFLSSCFSFPSSWAHAFHPARIRIVRKRPVGHMPYLAKSPSAIPCASLDTLVISPKVSTGYRGLRNPSRCQPVLALTPISRQETPIFVSASLMRGTARKCRCN